MGIAGIVALATLISKVFGLVREQAVAAAFGVGAVVNAYTYAYVVPGFLLVLLGGINGPFHSALVSVLAKKDKSEAAPLVETVTTLVSGILLVVTIALVLFADTLVQLTAPGLSEQVKDSAIQQLQIMAPLALLSGLIGIGFGTLNASDQYWLPSISPFLSSLTVVIGVLLLAFQLGGKVNDPQYLALGGVVLAGGTVAGAILQWLAQLFAQWKSGMGTLRLRFDWRTPGVGDVMKVMAPASLSSGMLHINVYTDLFFASYIPGAAAAMRYATFIVQTPLGIISNMILVPMLPIFSRLAAPENQTELKERIRQGLLLCALTMLPLSAIFMSLAFPIVRLVYERYAFKIEASEIVAPVLMAYGFGMFFYLARDVLVRVFYALGDGETPFKVSIFNILLNALLDYLLVNQFATPGLVLATVAVNFISMIMFLWILHRRLGGLPLKEWLVAFLGLTGASIVAGFASWGIGEVIEKYITTTNFFVQIGLLIFPVVVCLGVFTILAMQLKLPELDILLGRLRQKFWKKR